MMVKEIYLKHANAAKLLPDLRLVNEISLLERLIDNDDFADSCYIDDALDMYEAYRDECVLRVRHSYSIVKR